jgi:sensor histidine kinase regulating citrate/malate metabolism
MSATDDAREHLARTIEQLIDGRIPGPLTVVRLAEAAGVKRWVLTHRHPDLMRDFQQRAAHVNRDNPEVLKLHQRLTQLDTQNKDLRARVRELDDLVARYAQVINELTAQQAQHAGPVGDVIPLRSRG